MPCRWKEQSLAKDLRPRDVLDSSSDSDEKAPAAKPPSLPKRKLELEVETVEKKKKGRPRKDSRLLPMSLSVQVSLAVGASGAWTAPPHPGVFEPPRAAASCPQWPASVARVCPAVLRMGKPGLQAQPRSGACPHRSLPLGAGLRDASGLAVPRRPDCREGHCVCVCPSSCTEAADAGPPESLHPPGELPLSREP